MVDVVKKTFFVCANIFECSQVTLNHLVILLTIDASLAKSSKTIACLIFTTLSFLEAAYGWIVTLVNCAQAMSHFFCSARQRF